MFKDCVGNPPGGKRKAIPSSGGDHLGGGRRLCVDQNFPELSVEVVFDDEYMIVSGDEVTRRLTDG
jgi:hypothetical protein